MNPDFIDQRGRAKRVLIDDKLYTIERTLYCQSRGWEYLLSGEAGSNCRVCSAFPPGTKVFTSGEMLTFDN
jgi:hypothetical protein